MKKSRIAAVVLVVVAVGWIASGHLGGDAKEKAPKAKVEQEAKRFRVSVVASQQVARARRLILSGHTEADQRTMATTRTTGTVTELRVRRGSLVRAGEVIAVLSDEAREANVAQASARVEQRVLQLEARRRLVQAGNAPKLELGQYEADLKGAQAALAEAEAERDRGLVNAPLAGVVNELPVRLGQALAVGGAVAEVIALQPMLAIADVSERYFTSVKPGDRAQVRLVTGQQVEGTVRFVSNRANPQTRTYRVEVDVNNDAGAIPDGITCEVVLFSKTEPATQVARSALTFSTSGQLGVRTVDAQGIVAFAPISIVEDEGDRFWVSGLSDNARVIVSGQDFVKEGETVETVDANQPAASPPAQAPG